MDQENKVKFQTTLTSPEIVVIWEALQKFDSLVKSRQRYVRSLKIRHPISEKYYKDQRKAIKLALDSVTLGIKEIK